MVACKWPSAYRPNVQSTPGHPALSITVNGRLHIMLALGIDVLFCLN